MSCANRWTFCSGEKFSILRPVSSLAPLASLSTAERIQVRQELPPGGRPRLGVRVAAPGLVKPSEGRLGEPPAVARGFLDARDEQAVIRYLSDDRGRVRIDDHLAERIVG